MLAVAKFKKTGFKCGRIRKSVLYKSRYLLLPGVKAKNRFLLSFCMLWYDLEFLLGVSEILQF